MYCLPKGRASRSWPAGGRCSSVVYNKKVDRCLSVVIRRVVIEPWKTKRQLIVWCYKNRLDRGLRKKIRYMNRIICIVFRRREERRNEWHNNKWVMLYSVTEIDGRQQKNIIWKNPCNFYKNRRFRPIQNTSVKKILFSDGRFSMDF
jgi:hypothetical protein